MSGSAPTKLQRWLDLIAYLVGRRMPVVVDELMEKIPAYAAKLRTEDETARATARRTFERDKDELRRAGIPIRTVRYLVMGGEQIEGYRIDRRDFYLPYLRLVSGGSSGKSSYPDRARIAAFEVREDQLGLAVDALRGVASLPSFPFGEEARSALRKLTFDLEAGSAGAPVLFAERPGAAELRSALRELSDAFLARKRVRFRYHGLYRGEATERDVAPYALLFQGGHWYLVGHDATRDAVRVFRVGRMEDVQRRARTPQSADYRIPEEFDPDALLGRRAWELHEDEEQTVEADVLFRFPLSIWADRNGYGVLLKEHADGSCTRRFEVHQVDPFVRWLLGFEGDAVVQRPGALAAEMRAMAEYVAERHVGRQDD